jgi:endonuclease YncB( thermonuclease family)
MSVSFDRWRSAQRRQFKADLRLPRRTRIVRRPRAHGGRRWLSWLWRRRSTVRLAVLVGLALGLAVWQTSKAPSVPVIDGDTFKLAGQSIRLHGIDAPELAQTCDGWAAGEAARSALVALVAADTPECQSVTKDIYGRTVAICRVNGKDVGEAMVRSGMAYAVYADRYQQQERQAKVDRLGIHARRCARPADWRASHPK